MSQGSIRKTNAITIYLHQLGLRDSLSRNGIVDSRFVATILQHKLTLVRERQGLASRGFRNYEISIRLDGLEGTDDLLVILVEDAYQVQGVHGLDRGQVLQ